MARKVFISFLGFTNYTPIHYSIEAHGTSNTTEKIRFVQEATLSYLKPNLHVTSAIKFFVTSGALINWNDGFHKKSCSDETEWHEGLDSRLKSINLPNLHEKIDIPDGKNQNEIWEIFEIVYNQLEKGDELYFDITHSFRTLPMLNMVLISYAKLLKNITVKGIFYGAFEAKYDNNGQLLAPIWDLTAFSELQDWTSAVDGFIKYGNSDALAEISRDKIKPLLANTSGDTVEIELARKTNLLAKSLLKVTDVLQTNRGKDLFEGAIFETLNSNIDQVHNENIFPPLKPILKQVTSKTEKFSQKASWKNGFEAVNWCIEHKLIQQGYTMLLESVITYLCEKFQFDYTNEKDRENKVKAAIFIVNNGILDNEHMWSSGAKENAPVVRNIILKLNPEFCGRFVSLSTKRNDINHAGFVKTESPQNLVNKLKDDFSFFYEYIMNQQNETS